MTAAAGTCVGYRPSRVQRWANTMLTRALRKGRGPRFMRLLSVRGRRSGAIRSTPVVPVRDAEHTWVVSPFGDVSWTRNARRRRRGRAESRRRPHRLSRPRAERRRDRTRPAALPVHARGLFVGRQIRDASRPHPVFELTPHR